MVFIFGFTAILGNLISISAIPLVWYRMLIAAGFIFLFLLVRYKGELRWDRHSWKMLAAGTVIAGHWIAFFHAIKISTVSIALAGISTAAFFGSLLEPLFQRKKIDRKEIFLGLMVIVGLYIIFRFEGVYSAGLIVALISALLGASFSVINSELVKISSPYRITFMEMLGGGIIITIYMMIEGSFTLELLQLKTDDVVYLLILASVCTAYAFIETVALMRTISPFSFLLAVNLEPVYGILLAVLFFNEAETLNPWFFLGAMIIISTVFIDAILKNRSRRQRQNL